MRHESHQDLIHVPGRMSRKILPIVNRRRERDGYSWSFLIAKLLHLYVKKGDALWKKSA